jgi:hypothetical protein
VEQVLEIVMTKNSNHRATKLTASLFAAALLAGCHHRQPAPTTEAMAPDTTVAPAPETAAAAPVTAAPTTPDAAAPTTPPTPEAVAAPTAASAQVAMAAPTTAPAAEQAAAPAEVEPPPFSPHGERYDAEDAARSSGLFAQSMAAAGAKSDAMLYDRSFDGSTLNSLGQVKLDLLLKGTANGQPVVIYLNVPHDSFADRQTAVAAYLKTAGVPDQLQKLVEGPNTNAMSPGAYNLNSIYKGENATFTGEAADAAVPTVAAPAAAK